MNLTICQNSAGASLDLFGVGAEGFATGWPVLPVREQAAAPPAVFVVTGCAGYLGGLRVKVDRARAFSVPCCIVQKCLHAISFDASGEGKENKGADPLGSNLTLPEDISKASQFLRLGSEVIPVGVHVLAGM